MNINITAVRFSISDQLEAFAEKKVSKAIAKHDFVVSADVIMKLEKPEAKNNKEVEIRLGVAGSELFAKKSADSFEEAIDLCVDAVKKQLAKHKEKIKAH